MSFRRITSADEIRTACVNNTKNDDNDALCYDLDDTFLIDKCKNIFERDTYLIGTPNNTCTTKTVIEHNLNEKNNFFKDPELYMSVDDSLNTFGFIKDISDITALQELGINVEEYNKSINSVRNLLGNPTFKKFILLLITCCYIMLEISDAGILFSQILNERYHDFNKTLIYKFMIFKIENLHITWDYLIGTDVQYQVCDEYELINHIFTSDIGIKFLRQMNVNPNNTKEIQTFINSEAEKINNFFTPENLNKHDLNPASNKIVQYKMIFYNYLINDYIENNQGLQIIKYNSKTPIFVKDILRFKFDTGCIKGLAGKLLRKINFILEINNTNVIDFFNSNNQSIYDEFKIEVVEPSLTKFTEQDIIDRTKFVLFGGQTIIGGRHMSYNSKNYSKKINKYNKKIRQLYFQSNK